MGIAMSFNVLADEKVEIEVKKLKVSDEIHLNIQKDLNDIMIKANKKLSNKLEKDMQLMMAELEKKDLTTFQVSIDNSIEQALKSD